MPITVKLFASLREGRPAMVAHPHKPGITVLKIIQELDVPEKEVRLIFINGRHAHPEDPLADGDTLSMFPPIGGG